MSTADDLLKRVLLDAKIARDLAYLVMELQKANCPELISLHAVAERLADDLEQLAGCARHRRGAPLGPQAFHGRWAAKRADYEFSSNSLKYIIVWRRERIPRQTRSKYAPHRASTPSYF